MYMYMRMCVSVCMCTYALTLQDMTIENSGCHWGGELAGCLQDWKESH